MSTAEMSGGHWVTINGVHVYVKGNQIVSGPPELEGKTLTQAASEGKHIEAIHGAEKLLPDDPVKMREDFNRTGKLPEHLQKLVPKLERLRADNPQWRDVTPTGYGPGGGAGHDNPADSSMHHDADINKLQSSLNEAKTIMRGNVLSKEQKVPLAQSIKKMEKKLKTMRAKYGKETLSADDIENQRALARDPELHGELVLSADEQTFQPAVTLGQGLPSEKDGHKIAYYWKEVLRPGKYQDAKGNPFEISDERINLLLTNFNKAKANGFRPHVPNGHTNDATKNLGFVIDARVNKGGGLELMHQLVGEDAILAAARNKSSVFTVKDFEDEHGQKYDELILHNAICPDPQLSNLSDFQPALAASRGMVATAIVLQPASYVQEPEMDLTKLRESIGAGKEISDEQVISQAIAKLGETKTALELSKGVVTTRESELSTLKTRAEAAEGKVLELSRGQPDEQTLNGWADLQLSRIDLAVEQGKCVKAQADLLKESIKKDNKLAPTASLMLSRSAGTSPVDLALKVLELNKPFVGTVTGAQPLIDPNTGTNPMTDGRADGTAYQNAQLQARGLAAA